MEMPSITASSYNSSSLDPDLLLRGVGALPSNNLDPRYFGTAMAQFGQPHKQPQNQARKEIQPMSTARIVKVFIADPNDSLPLDKRVLYSGEEKLTDLTDQELFFEVPIKELMDKHNTVRVATPDKKATEKWGREIMLEPARIRDLKMVVVTVAQF